MAEEEGQYGEATRNKPKVEEAYDVVDAPVDLPAEKPSLKIDKPSVLEGFDEDTDFDKDLGLKGAKATQGSSSPRMHVMPNPLAMPAESEEEAVVPSNEPLIRQSWIPLKGAAVVGAGCALAAAAMRWYQAPELGSGLPMALLTLYFCALHAVTGVVALIIMSLLQHRPAGEYRLGLVRMLVAVGLFMVLAQTGLPLNMSFLVAAAGYLLALMLLFRLRPNVAVQLAGVHAAIFFVVQLGFLLQELSFSPTKGGR